MRTIDILSLRLHPFGSRSVTMIYAAEELVPGFRLLEARRCPKDHRWPEIEVKDIDDFTLVLKIADIPENEFPEFEATLDDSFVLTVKGVGEMTFALDEDPEDDDGRWDAYS